MGTRTSPVEAAGVVFLDAADRVLLVHQTYGRRAWSLPGGIVEQGEAPRAAASREVREEIGLTASIGRLIGVYRNEKSNASVFAYLGELPVGAEPLIADEAELDGLGWFPLDALPEPSRTSLPAVIADVVLGR